MVVAGGIVKVDDLSLIEHVAGTARKMGVEVDEPEADRFFFVLRGTSLEVVEHDIRSLKDIAGVSHVHVTYYSLEEDRRKAHREGPWKN